MRREARTGVGICWVLATLASAASGQPVSCPTGAEPRVEEREGARTEMCVDADGKLEGSARTFRGGIVRREDHWRHGVPHGASAVFDEHGVRREQRSHEDGRLVGPETFFHPSGRPQSTTHYAAGKKQGPIAEWAPDGTQLVDGAFANDEPAGTWIGAKPGEPLTAIVHAGGKRARALELESGCGAWKRAEASTRTQFAADFALLILTEFEQAPVAPIGEIDRFAAARCIVSGLGAIEAAMDASCVQGERDPIGDATSTAVAQTVGECLLSARRAAH